MPIGLAPHRQVSVKALVSPRDPPSPAAMTIKFLRLRPPPPQEVRQTDSLFVRLSLSLSPSFQFCFSFFTLCLLNHFLRFLSFS